MKKACIHIKYKYNCSLSVCKFPTMKAARCDFSIPSIWCKNGYSTHLKIYSVCLHKTMVFRFLPAMNVQKFAAKLQINLNGSLTKKRKWCVWIVSDIQCIVVKRKHIRCTLRCLFIICFVSNIFLPLVVFGFLFGIISGTKFFYVKISMPQFSINNDEEYTY